MADVKYQVLPGREGGEGRVRVFPELRGMPERKWNGHMRVRIQMRHRGPVTFQELAAACEVRTREMVEWGVFSDVLNELLAEGKVLVRTRMESGVLVPYLLPATVRIQEVRRD